MLADFRSRADAFTFSWTDIYIYCFPPFRILEHVIRKIQAAGVTEVVVAPHCPGQPWFPLLRKLAVAYKSYPKHPDNLVEQGLLSEDSDADLIKATKLTVFLFWHTH